jgi:hypothetical protein
MPKGKHAMAIPQLVSHSLLIEQVEDMLQRRLIQEIDIIFTRLAHSRHIVGDPEAMILRRMSQEELDTVEQIGAIGLKGVSAIIIGNDLSSQLSTSNAFKAFRMIRDTSVAGGSRLVPLYNTGAFLSSDNLARANILLRGILRTEANVQSELPAIQVSEDDRTQNAYLLFSTPETIVRADTVPVLIALWRLRLWAGQGWEDGLWGNW